MHGGAFPTRTVHVHGLVKTQLACTSTCSAAAEHDMQEALVHASMQWSREGGALAQVTCDACIEQELRTYNGHFVATSRL